MALEEDPRVLRFASTAGAVRALRQIFVRGENVRVWLLALVVLVCWPATLVAQEGGQKNPFTSSEDVAAGGRIFRSHCAVCHGVGGTGGRATDLTSGQFRHGSSDEALFRNISEGIPGTEMPAIFYQGQQLWQMVAYVRSLSEKAAKVQAAGDPAAGKKLFEEKGGCLQCHMAAGKGSRLGPDLSNIGAKRSLAHLTSSVAHPNENVLPQHYAVRAVTKDGKRISGTRLNEDTYSIQLLDSSENLLSLRKADLTEYQIEKASSMPAYEGTLSGNELNDVVAYLATLQQ